MFYLFLSKELFKAPFTVFQEMEIFFLSKNFVKAKVNGNLMVQCLVNMANESELPSQAVTVFALVIKEMCHLVFSQWKIKNFLLSNSRYFLLYDAFSWSNWEQCLLELIYDFPEEAHNRGLPSNLTIYTVSLSLDEDQSLMWLVVGLFCLPHNIFHSTLLISNHFSPPIRICFKNGAFLLNLNSHMWKYGQEGFFFFLTYVAPKHQSN